MPTTGMMHQKKKKWSVIIPIKGAWCAEGLVCIGRPTQEGSHSPNQSVCDCPNYAKGT